MSQTRGTSASVQSRIMGAFIARQCASGRLEIARVTASNREGALDDSRRIHIVVTEPEPGGLHAYVSDAGPRFARRSVGERLEVFELEANEIRARRKVGHAFVLQRLFRSVLPTSDHQRDAGVGAQVGGFAGRRQRVENEL